MTRPKIRHLALVVRKPDVLARFYQEHFDMEIIRTDPDGSFWLSDGYMNVALMKLRMGGEAPVGINHFGFTVDDVTKMSAALTAAGVEEPALRPSTTPFSEFRAIDLEGNWFDLSEHGYGIP